MTSPISIECSCHYYFKRSLVDLITFKLRLFGYASKKLFASGSRADDTRTGGSDVALLSRDETLRQQGRVALGSGA